MIRRNELTTQQSSNGAVITVIYKFGGKTLLKSRGREMWLGRITT